MGRDIAGWVARAVPEELYSAVGLTWTTLEPGRCEQLLVPGPDLVDEYGRLSAVALAILADSALGTAAATVEHHDAAVTVGMRLDLTPGWAQAREMVARARGLTSDGWLLGTGELLAQESRVGVATIRCRAVELAQRRTRTRDVRSSADRGDPLDGRDVGSPDAFLGVHTLRSTAGAAALAARARPELANGAGTLHGGVVAGLGFRAARAALDEDQPWGMLTLDVDFVRAVPADGGRVYARARVVERTRQLAWSEALVTRGDGRPAARVRCLHVVE